jgi:RNA polymerase sigma factor (sigma-70 family)
MSANRVLRPVVGYLQHLARCAANAAITDRQLLMRFARDRDEEAFRTLVQRHGDMVFEVCRRALGRHQQDAEDCFQASFMLLARKAASVRWQESVAGWLHQAAIRIAADIRLRDARRRRREQEAARRGVRSVSGRAMADRPSLALGAPTNAALCDMAAVVDAEVELLPARCREPVLLCYLQGLARDQAAVRLGLSLRTLERRLQAARAMLRARLLRRGVTMSAGLLAWGLTQDAGAGMPRALMAATSRAAAAFAQGTGMVLAPRAAALVHSALHESLWSKLNVAAALLVVTFALTLGGNLLQPTAAPAGHPEAGAGAALARQAPTGPRPAAKVSLQEAGTAHAVEEGLRWLMRQQMPEGGWKLDAATPNDTAATALALLPLIAAQDRAPRPASPYTNATRRGLKALAEMQTEEGGLAGGMYAQGLATMALAEGYRVTGDAALRRPAQLAINYVVKAQHTGGGWRYAPGQVGDTSVTTWQVLALTSGKKAGLDVPAATLVQVSVYLDTVASAGGSAYSYVAGGGAPGTPSMTAGGLLCRYLLGWEARQPAMLKGAARLLEAAPSPQQSNSYYFHLATRLMHAIDGPEWTAWESRIVRVLLSRQDRRGVERGSWLLAGDLYGTAGGRIMVTSLSLLALQQCGEVTVPLGEAKEPLTPEQAKADWEVLAGGDLGKTRDAMIRLAASPQQVVPFLRDQLRFPAPPDTERVSQLISNLGSDDFNTRSSAFRELEKLGEGAAPALAKALKDAGPLETRRRLEQLLEKADPAAATPARIRQLRALQVLELTGTVNARSLLESVAKQAPAGMIREAARAALKRMEASSTP